MEWKRINFKTFLIKTEINAKKAKNEIFKIVNVVVI